MTEMCIIDIMKILQDLVLEYTFTTSNIEVFRVSYAMRMVSNSSLSKTHF